MKLRNKKTGEIAELSDEEYDAYKTFVELMDCDHAWVECDPPKEPLIKNEKIKEEIVAGIKEVIKKVSALDSELGELLVAALTDYACFEKGMFNGKPCKYAKQYRYAKSEKGKEAKRRYYQKHKEEIKRKRVAKNGKS